MKLLIVEDHSSLAELTADLLHSLDRQVQELEAITLVSDLQTTTLCLPEHEGVLHKGLLPLSPNSRWAVEEWEVIRQEAPRRGMYFVFYSGSSRALDYAGECPPALAKPAALEEIYAALARHRVSVLSKGHAEPARMREYGKHTGEDHVAKPGRVEITDGS